MDYHLYDLLVFLVFNFKSMSNESKRRTIKEKCRFDFSVVKNKEILDKFE